MVNYGFVVKSRSKTETIDGTKYKVKLKCGEGHALTLVAGSKAIFEGYRIGDTVDIIITNLQKTFASKGAPP